MASAQHDPLRHRLQTLIQQWQDEFVALDRRNRLVHCDPEGRSVVDLLLPELATAAARLSNNSSLSFIWREAAVAKAVKKSEQSESPIQKPKTFDESLRILQSLPEYHAEHHIVTRLTDSALDTRLRTIRTNARTAESEQGASVLYLALGLLKWFDSPDSDVPFLSPLALVPVTLKKSGVDPAWSLSVADEEGAIVANRALALLLQGRLQLPEPPESLDALEEFLGTVKSLLAGELGGRAEIVPRAVLGIFGFQKLAMYEDLKANAEHIGEQRLVRLLAGDVEARSPHDGLAGAGDVSDASLRPQDLFTVKDCDHSQLRAIAYARDGLDLVIDGPPGTGKSQTITNIIADSLARGKKVLFVSEKVAALEVVRKRLAEVGLADYCLELHSHKQQRKEILGELVRCLDLTRVAQPVDEHQLEVLVEGRRCLNDYVTALHSREEGESWTLFEAQGRFASLQDAPDVPCDLAHIRTIGRAQLEGIGHQLDAFAAQEKFIATSGRHPWNALRVARLSLTQKSSLKRFFSAAVPLLRQVASDTSSIDDYFADGTRTTIGDLNSLADFLVNVPGPLTKLPSRWFEFDRATIDGGLNGFLAAAQTLMPALGCVPQYICRQESDTVSQLRQVQACLSQVGALLPQESAYTFEAALRELSALVPKVEPLRQAIAAAFHEARTLGTLVGFSDNRISAISPAALKWTCDLLEQVARAGKVDNALLSCETRRRVRECKEAYAGQQQAAQELRESLIGTYLPSAFSEDGVAAAEGLLSFRPWWRRFGKSWRNAKSAVERYWANAPSRTRDLFSAADALCRWGMHNAKARECVAACPVRVPSAGKEIPAFDVLERQAQVAELFEKGRFSAGEVSAVCASVGNARTEIGKAVAAARATLSALRRTQADLPSTLIQVLFQGQSVEKSQLVQSSQHTAAALDGIQRLKHVLNELQDAIAPIGACALRDLPRVIEAIQSMQAACATLGLATESDFVESADMSIHEPAVRLMQQVKSLYAANVPSIVRKFLESGPGAGATPEKIREAVNPGLLKKAKECCSQLNGAFVPPKGLGDVAMWKPAQTLEWLGQLDQSMESMDEFFAFRELVQSLRGHNLGALVDLALAGQIQPQELRRSFEKAFFMHKVDELAQRRGVAGFNAQAHEQVVQRFRDVDRSSFAVHQARAKACLDNSEVRDLSESHPQEVQILRTEAAMTRGRKKLRRIFGDIQNLLLRIKPCVMMSPLSVSTFFPGEASGLRFDVVVIDEASQVKPADAIPAIYRSRQIIVAGDDQQLPPSNFFNKVAHDGDDGDGNGDPEAGPDSEPVEGEVQQAAVVTAIPKGIESILDMCVSQNLRRARLLWHYRSRHETLIAFSNHEFYGNELVTFPSAHKQGGVTFHHVENGKWIDNTNPEEAKAVVDLVADYLREHPDESLGIVTFNQPQQLLVEDELERLRQRLRKEGGHEELLERLAEDREEPLFIKNLENVQGDERDCIILSVAYAKTPAGQFQMRFGPVSQAGGQRRLNVAITRARRAMMVVASVRPDEFRVSSASPSGTRLLHSFLRFACEGPSAIAQPVGETRGGYESPFEEAVATALGKTGLEIVPQVGCGKFRIDLGVLHPKDPNRFVLGIECDGATYHRSPVARDRDRLRQEVLEELGWRIVRIWSTDWVHDPQRQVAKVLAAYEREVAAVV